MKGWDYAVPGYYFVTVCTKDRFPWFGEIADGKMIYTLAGKVVEQELENTVRIRKNVSIDTRIIVPDHVHVIIGETLVETPRRGVSTIRTWKSGTLGAIINQFKSVCTKRIRKLGWVDFAWQARFYDHILRNENELENIRAYIAANQLIQIDDCHNVK